MNECVLLSRGYINRWWHVGATTPLPPELSCPTTCLPTGSFLHLKLTWSCGWPNPNLHGLIFSPHSACKVPKISLFPFYHNFSLRYKIFANKILTERWFWHILYSGVGHFAHFFCKYILLATEFKSPLWTSEFTTFCQFLQFWWFKLELEGILELFYLVHAFFQIQTRVEFIPIFVFFLVHNLDILSSGEVSFVWGASFSVVFLDLGGFISIWFRYLSILHSWYLLT